MSGAGITLGGGGGGLRCVAILYHVNATIAVITAIPPITPPTTPPTTVDFDEVGDVT